MTDKIDGNLKNFAQELWNDWLARQPLEYWLNTERELTEEELEKFPLAKKAAKLKNTKLYKVLK